MFRTVILLDCFGTVFDMENIPSEDINYYGYVIKKPFWEPLNLPEKWNTIPAFPDSKEAIHKLRHKGYEVVALSNAPASLIEELSKYNKIKLDHIIPLEKYKIYKPNPLAYLTACSELDCKPSDCIMVTANKTFGDLEAAKTIGMKSILVRDTEDNDLNNLEKIIAKY